jgi:hypothetical protein
MLFNGFVIALREKPAFFAMMIERPDLLQRIIEAEHRSNMLFKTYPPRTKAVCVPFFELMCEMLEELPMDYEETV